MNENYLETYEYGIITSDFIDSTTTNSLSDKILERESYIKGLSDESKLPMKIVNSGNLTNYHSYYNLIDLGFSETDILVSKIKELIFNTFGWENFHIKMWANIFRKGDYLGLHKHMDNMSSKKFPYAVSGHCFLYSSEKTYTTYLFKKKKIGIFDSSINVVDIQNNPGEVSIFSSYVEHEFKKWDGDLRVGIAFDINNQPEANIQWLQNRQFRYV
jgi:hypothetical protein